MRSLLIGTVLIAGIFASPVLATEQAKAKANAANTAKDAEAERSKLKAALDQANAEIERLKSEQQQTVPPVPVSPPPGEASPPAGQ
jgi:phosphoenolpyruvate-protein kinase (PTS system EI component)